jgi:hypothetical protein
LGQLYSVYNVMLVFAQLKQSQNAPTTERIYH